MEINEKLQFNRYEYIIENIKDVIWELNKDYVFTFVSPNVKGMTGYKAEELIGYNITEFLVEESRKYFSDQVIQRVNNWIKGDADVEEIIFHDVQFICKDGLAKWIEVAPKLIIEEERFTGYIGITRDITEKKEYEYQLGRYILELERINEELQKTATTDILTGAYNRRKFDYDLDLIITRQEKENIQFSMIFLDIDHFKTINDLWGHKIGDLVLQKITKSILENINVTSLYRWGGEEFIIILPEADLASAEIVAEKARNTIQNEDFGIEQSITISLGVCEYKADENADQIIARLDKALYKAKIQGRNRVVIGVCD